MYLDVSQTAVSSALIRESDEAQKPVYYTIQAFKGVEAWYFNIEKMVFALITSSWKLRPYFQAHSIIMLTNQPIKKVMNKLNVAGWLVFWAVKLGKFDVKYRPQTTIKAQALANLIADDGCFSSSVDITSWALATAKARSSQKLVANFPLSWPFEDQGGGVSSSIETVREDGRTLETFGRADGAGVFSKSPFFFKRRLLFWKLISGCTSLPPFCLSSAYLAFYSSQDVSRHHQ